MRSLLGQRLRGNRVFALLWGADAVSVTGSQISGLAIPTVAILVLGAGPIGVGILGALQRLPLLLLSMISGVIADRSRQPVRLLIAGNLICAIAIGSIPAAAMFGHLTLAHLFVAVAIAASAEQLVEMTAYSIMPSAVTRDQFADANARLETTRQGSTIIGPGLAGSLIQLAGPVRAILADAASFLISAVLVTQLRLPPRPPRVAARRGVMRDLIDGARFVFGDRRLRRCALASATSNIGGGLGQAVMLLFLYREAHLSPGAVGLIATLTGVLGPILALNTRMVTRRIGLGMTLVISGVFYGAGTAVMALAIHLPALPIVIVGFLLVGIEGGLWNVSMITLRQMFTPDELFGRMVATTRTVAQGTSPVAMVAGGFLGSAIGLAPTLVIAGTITALCGLFLLDGELLRAGQEARSSIPTDQVSSG
jgi:MFS family permease